MELEAPLTRTPSQLPTPFRSAAEEQRVPEAGGILKDKYGRYRTLYDQRARTTVLVNLASILERSNEQTLPALYKYVGRSFDASPRQLGMVTLGCALVQALASPIGGLLGHYHDRVTILSFGCFLWGLMAASFAMCNTLAWGAFFWSFNGAGLALLIPNAQSLIADYFKPVSRGTAFGALYLTGAVGGMLGALFATNLGGMRFQSLEGWRLAFLIVAFASAVVGLLNYFYSVDPRYKAEHPQYVQDPDIFKQQPVSLARMGADILSVISVPSFILVVAQGIIGSTPWNGLVFNTLYLQLLGFSDFHASLISSLFLGGTAIGGLIGGILGDISSSMSPNHGRVLVAQFSVGIGVPMAAVVYKLLPTGPPEEAPPLLLYCAAFLSFGILVSWAAPACTSPIFADVVPSQQRSLVFSFDRAFEGAVASMGAPIVGWLAERFGFSTHSKSPGPDLDSAAALGDAMLLCTAIPWAVCALMFSGLHITYQRDKKAAIAYQRARSGFATGSYSLLQPIPEGDGDGDGDEDGDRDGAVGGTGLGPELETIGSYRMPMPNNNNLRGPLLPRSNDGGRRAVSRSL